MSDRPDIRLAVIGCGLMGRRHAAIIRATPGARLVALLDRCPDAAAQAALPGETVTDDFDALLASPGVDGVVLCLPSSLHAEFGIRAARAGRHVIVEKPIDSDPERARALAAECAAAGVVCAEIKQYRFSDGMAALKEAVGRGDLGPIVLARASIRWFRHDPYYTESDWRGRLAGEGGGVLINQAIHATDYLIWLLGRPDCVSALTQSNRPDVMETEDTAVALMKFPGGALASLEASTSAFPGFDERYEIQGRKGSCFLEKGRIVFWQHEDGLPPPAPPPFAPASEGLDAKLTLFQRQYRNILAAIRGEADLAVTPEEAIATLDVTHAFYASAAAGSRQIQFSSGDAS